jgi:hypothetical protein
MKKVFCFLILALSLSFFSCKSSKQSYEKKPMPDWVTRKPQSAMFYTGVSSAAKAGTPPSEYVQSAQQRALGDLAASISVNIESSSMLSIIESNFNISENFQRDITASTSQELEGYELVDTWEDDYNYWVYYRLSRDKYHQIRQQKKNKAIEDAKTKYIQAQHVLSKNMHYNAFQFYSDALADIKIYLGESTNTKIEDNEVDLGNHIFMQIAEFLRELNISHPLEEIRVKRGVELNPEQLTFSVLDANNIPVSNIPFRINFTGGGLLRNSETSGSDGKFVCAIRRVSSTKSVETLSVSVDMNGFSRMSKDPMIRNILRNMPAPEKTMRVVIEKPTVFITSDEREMNKASQHTTLKNSMVGNLGRDFDVMEDKNKADYFVHIESNTAIKGTYINEHYVTITCRIDMTDKNGNNLFRRTIENDHMGPDYLNASRTAYTATARTIERTTAREIVNAIN